MPWPVRALLGWIGLTLLAALLFYPVENWRGKRAWEQCKRELAKKGESVNWGDFLPKPVPDAQNFYKAPHMTEWFLGRDSNDLLRRQDESNLNAFTRRTMPCTVIELDVVTNRADIMSSGADICLRYGSSVLSAWQPDPDGTPPGGAIPLIVVQDTPIRDFVRNVARQGNLKCEFDPEIVYDNSDHPEPIVNYRQENVTLMQAMITVLSANGLQWIDDPKTGVARITKNIAGKKQIYVEPVVSERITVEIRRVLDSITNDLCQPGLTSAEGFRLVPLPVSPTKPRRIAVLAEKPPELDDVSAFFPASVTVAGDCTLTLGIESAPSGYIVFLGSRPYTAAQYLAWSDQMLPDLDGIRTALKRPYAQMDGDFRHPWSIPVPYYKAMKSLSLVLQRRVQSLLLLGKSAEALSDLTLIHELGQMLRGKPTGRPMPFVTPMIRAVMVSAYVSAVADGLQRHAWSDSQMIVIQKQLAEVDLLQQVVEGFRTERAAILHNIETVRTNGTEALQLARTSLGKLHAGFWFVPPGWWEQNCTFIARTLQLEIESIDVPGNSIRLEKLAEFQSAMNGTEKFNPYTFFGILSIPNFTHGVFIAAHNQTLANQCLIACALERHRLATGKYPVTLGALPPRFIEKIPNDLMSSQPLKYRLTDNDGFTLYSAGRDGVDHGGKTSVTAGERPKLMEGDWIWGQFPDS